METASNSKKLDFAKLNEEIFKGNKEWMNSFFQSAYERIRSQFKNKGKYIEFHFNTSKEEVKRLVMRCKYAIKFAHKEMANNASTIISCFGMYLPTFTASGLVAGDEFKDPKSYNK